MRLALFGGTFDPIHRAHLLVAQEAAEVLRLDRVLFVPAAHPPWKEAATPYEQRFAMVELACAGDVRFEASRLEDGAEKNYTIDTVERARGLYPGDALFFIIGADAFAEIHKWHRSEDLLRAVEFIVVTRPGHRYDSLAGAKVHRLDTVALPVSSSEIRAELARGETPADLPAEVARYAFSHGLYRG